MKTTVIFHSADNDGLFCRSIARKFLPDAELIGWDFGDAPLEFPKEGMVYVMDLPVDRVFGFDFDGDGFTKHTIETVDLNKIIWLDHHKSSIQTHPEFLRGYRIDGVAACRLAWQWFTMHVDGYQEDGRSSHHRLTQLASKQDFIDRKVSEPLAVTLAGEYDIWDKRDYRAELFQSGLRSQEVDFQRLLQDNADAVQYTAQLLENGKSIKYARDQEYREVITQQGFEVEWEGQRWLACNSHELDIRSQLFEAMVDPERHNGLIGFTFTGHDWRVSLYQVKDNEHIDMSEIAKRHGGGGHRGAAGFRCNFLPFPLRPFQSYTELY